MAHIERRQGHFAQAKPLYRKTLLEWQRLGHRAAIAHELECFALIAGTEGNAYRAALLFGAAEALRENIGSRMTSYEQTEYDAGVASLQAITDAALFTSTWEKGRSLTIEEAIAYALEQQKDE